MMNDVCNWIFHVPMQIGSAESDDALRQLFLCEDMQTIVLDTGFRKPLTSLVCTDKYSLMRSIRNFYTILRSKAALDQNMEGLNTLDVQEMIKKYPSYMKPLFVYERKQLSKGTYILLVYSVYVNGLYSVLSHK